MKLISEITLIFTVENRYSYANNGIIKPIINPVQNILLSFTSTVESTKLHQPVNTGYIFHSFSQDSLTTFLY